MSHVSPASPLLQRYTLQGVGVCVCVCVCKCFRLAAVVFFLPLTTEVKLQNKSSGTVTLQSNRGQI